MFRKSSLLIPDPADGPDSRLFFSGCAWGVAVRCTSEALPDMKRLRSDLADGALCRDGCTGEDAVGTDWLNSFLDLFL